MSSRNRKPQPGSRKRGRQSSNEEGEVGEDPKEEIKYSADDMKDLEAFMMMNDDDDDELEEEEEEEEENEEERMRKKRHEEIMRKHEKDSKSEEMSDTKSSKPASGSLISRLTEEDQEKEVTTAPSFAVLDDAKASAVFDMFGDSPEPASPSTTNNNTNNNSDKATTTNNTGNTNKNSNVIQSNIDDMEGYYVTQIGEVIGDRYKVLGLLGKGVFSSVLKCVDISGNGDKKIGENGEDCFVALKLIRNNDTMRKAAAMEHLILISISNSPSPHKRFLVNLINYLPSYHNHVVMVFECLSSNLREILKKFGRNVGLNIDAVRRYGTQLLLALSVLEELKIIHADLKLDNILVSDDLKIVKICDFGSAFYTKDVEAMPTPYLVSRFYRAPEVILGCPAGIEIDLWSIGVTLYELYTDEIMFKGGRSHFIKY